MESSRHGKESARYEGNSSHAGSAYDPATGKGDQDRSWYFGGDPPTTPDEKHSATEEWYERLARVCMEVSEDAELHKPKSQGPTLKSIFKGVSSALHFSSHRSDETVHKSDLSEPLLE